ncbi:helix-turn-helix transcriptional regulator [Sphingobacterium pedocola]|uniref:XRE family transcriptional regulator n=1 Tax=Sphingobacterium pedocola TaxID=2082722 RepID=A0ABR9T693_9SPHI|nr:helix-turn-helix transcriptional regulator [Sphingobacterium pedocola]MBE8720846.1 XRE family transcriptional regulator [Sphingobacterium pedocola]
MTNKEKFLTLVSKEETKTVERAKARLTNKKYSKLSNLIAFEILERLDALGWKQKDLAEKMGVSPQQVNKWVKGNENFTIETLVNLSEVLGVELIAVATKKDQKLVEEVRFTYSEVYDVSVTQKRLVPRITMNENRVYENPYAIAN